MTKKEGKKFPIYAIDPGTTESAFVLFHKESNEIITLGKDKNENILKWIRETYIAFDLVIEGINPYTMGKTTRDTILWSGRFQEAYEYNSGNKCQYLYRNDVRQNLCNSKATKINDTVIIEALVDRFAYGQKNKGKGTKKEPGFFFGFSKDIWQAFALAVTWHDLNIKH